REASDFVDDALGGSGAKLAAKLIRNDQGPCRRFKPLPRFQNAHTPPTRSHCSCREQTCGGASHNDDLSVFSTWPGPLFSAWHDFVFPSRAYTRNFYSAGHSRSNFPRVLTSFRSTRRDQNKESVRRQPCKYNESNCVGNLAAGLRHSGANSSDFRRNLGDCGWLRRL